MVETLTVSSCQVEEALQTCVEPVRHPDVRARLREISKELKHMDGEHWAIGEMLERVCNFLDSE